MRPENVFRRYDIRGEHPGEIDEAFAELLGKSVGTFSKMEFSGRVIVCRDNKESSKALKEALISGLKSSGVKVIDVGMGPTDYAGFSGKEHSAVSVQVTSSHMPLRFNGFKLMYPEGNGFVNEDLDEVKEIFRERDFSRGEGSYRGMEKTMKQRYRDRVRMRGSRLGSRRVNARIVVDSLGGATKELLPQLLRDIGVEVIEISAEKDEHPYRDPPNPKPENLEELEKRVEEEDADLGIATDMDGDRLTAYYNGRFLSGYEVFGLMAQATRSDVVASIDTARGLEEYLNDINREVFYTRVGDPFVMEKALEEDVDLAGEPNGHYAFLEFLPYNSGILTALVLAGTDLEEGLEELPDYSVERFSVKVDDREAKMQELEQKIKEKYEVLSEVDGVKFRTDRCDVLVRPSGSSEKIRVIIQADSEKKVTRDIATVRQLVQNP
ncbi:MAG: hypothetical protein ABEJ87_00540 [Candidatus Nanohalobium sp.]